MSTKIQLLFLLHFSCGDWILGKFSIWWHWTRCDICDLVKCSFRWPLHSSDICILGHLPFGDICILWHLHFVEILVSMTSQLLWRLRYGGNWHLVILMFWWFLHFCDRCVLVAINFRWHLIFIIVCILVLFGLF